MRLIALASILWEESGEGTDFEQATLIPRGIEPIHLPVLDVGVQVPRLGLIVHLCFPFRCQFSLVRCSLLILQRHG
jgi:hypothetical protein